MNHAIEQLRESESSTNDTIERHLQAILDHVDTFMPPDEKARLATLVHRNSDFFSRSELGLGSTNVVKHRIVIGDNRPCRQPQRPQPVTT